jgi:predicted metalloprotease with PDZ domain
MKPWLGLVLLAPLSWSPGLAAGAPVMQITLKPGPMSERAGGTIAVTETVPCMDVPAGGPLMSIENVAPGMSFPQAMEGLTVSDRRGVVPLVPNQTTAPTSWNAARAIKGDMVVSYRLPIVNDTHATGGPQGSPRIDGDGFSSVGDMLFIQPNTRCRYPVSVKWDLVGMGAGAQAVSTFGEGDFTLPTGGLARLSNAFYMAGHLNRQPEKLEGAFSAVWTGDPGFDPRPSLRWAQQLHGWMSRFFRDRSEPPYRIFLRYNPAANAGGGTAFPHSFLWTYGDGVAADHMKAILGHEMTHTWTAAAIGKWFDEGNAVYYQERLPWRAGMVSTSDYLADINLTAARYYTNELSHLADAAVMSGYWTDVRKIVIPYDRGAIYFAVLDSRIRAASGGKRSIDDLIRVIVDRVRREDAVTEQDWIALLRGELGEDGVKIHSAMMAGNRLVPSSDAYGPCFHRVAARIRRYDLGYDVGRAKAGAVTDLEPGSEAAKAGIRNGDQIVLRTNTDGAQRDPNMTLTVKITRDGVTFPITYLPRGEAVDAYQWERTPDVPDNACRP